MQATINLNLDPYFDMLQNVTDSQNQRRERERQKGMLVERREKQQGVEILFPNPPSNSFFCKGGKLFFYLSIHFPIYLSISNYQLINPSISVNRGFGVALIFIIAYFLLSITIYNPFCQNKSGQSTVFSSYISEYNLSLQSLTQHLTGLFKLDLS